MRIPFPWGRREELHLLAADPAPLCGRLRGARVRAQPHREGEGIRGMVQLLLPGDPIWLQEGGLDAPPLGVGSRERASSYQWVGGGRAGVSGRRLCCKIFHWSVLPGASLMSEGRAPGRASDSGRACVFWVFSLLGRIGQEVASERPLCPGGHGTSWGQAVPGM